MTFNEVHKLIKKGDAVALRHALDEGVSPNLANQFSWTLLMLAAMEGDICIGELFVSRGAVLDTTNDFGETALSLAAHAGHLPFTRLLLSNGASIELSSTWTQSRGLDQIYVGSSQRQNRIGSGAPDSCWQFNKPRRTFTMMGRSSRGFASYT
jgi:ankyrin repeat protein